MYRDILKIMDYMETFSVLMTGIFQSHELQHFEFSVRQILVLGVFSQTNVSTLSFQSNRS